MIDLKIARKAYIGQRKNSRGRKIPFLILFEDWCRIWEESGHFHERGRGKEKYVMSRYGDKGGYEVGNVFIQTGGANLLEATIGNTHSRRPNPGKRKWWANPENKAKTAAKISKTKTGVSTPHPMFRKRCSINGVEFESYTAAVKALGKGKNGVRCPSFKYL